MDPFCKVICGKKTFKTKVHEGGGKYPTWSDEFTMNYASEDKMVIHVYDKESLMDDDHVIKSQYIYFLLLLYIYITYIYRLVHAQ